MKFDESMPIYLQIKGEIEKAIISGAIPEGDMIPSIRSLATQYRLNPQTISNAVSDLLSDGYLFKKRGIGMFVEQGAQSKLRELKSDIFRNEELWKVIRKGKTLGISRKEIGVMLDSIYNEED